MVACEFHACAAQTEDLLVEKANQRFLTVQLPVLAEDNKELRLDGPVVVEDIKNDDLNPGQLAIILGAKLYAELMPVEEKVCTCAAACAWCGALTGLSYVAAVKACLSSELCNLPVLVTEFGQALLSTECLPLVCCRGEVSCLQFIRWLHSNSRLPGAATTPCTSASSYFCTSDPSLGQEERLSAQHRRAPCQQAPSAKSKPAGKAASAQGTVQAGDTARVQRKHLRQAGLEAVQPLRPQLLRSCAMAGLGVCLWAS